MINQHKSLAELYSDLLIMQREIVREQDNGSAVCKHCKCQQRNHTCDDRCSIDALSLKFRDVRQEELERIVKAIEHVEALRGL